MAPKTHLINKGNQGEQYDLNQHFRIYYIVDQSQIITFTDQNHNILSYGIHLLVQRNTNFNALVVVIPYLFFYFDFRGLFLFKSLYINKNKIEFH